MEITSVLNQLEERKREIDITIQTLRQELAARTRLSSSVGQATANRPLRRAPMSAARKKALSAKLKKIWAARKAKAS